MPRRSLWAVAARRKRRWRRTAFGRRCRPAVGRPMAVKEHNFFMSDLSIQPAAHGPLHAIRNVASLSHASPSGIHRLDPFDPAPLAGARADRVEVSEMAHLLARMRDMPD